MARGRITRLLTTRFDGADGSVARVPDDVVVEEVLHIRLDGHAVATTMRTPGDDFELAVGFCHGEGLLEGAPVRTCRYCATASAVETGFNIVDVDTGGRAPVPAARLGPTTSSCGVCGTADPEALFARLAPLPAADPPPLGVLAQVPERVRGHQELFARTGAVHAAAAVDHEGTVVVAREDIGRHNAVDKVVGRLLLDGVLPARGLVLFVSGRASSEMVQKAWAAGFATVVAVSAPSSLAVELARRAGIVLAGFARDGSMRVYAPELLR